MTEITLSLDKSTVHELAALADDDDDLVDGREFAHALARRWGEDALETIEELEGADDVQEQATVVAEQLLRDAVDD